MFQIVPLDNSSNQNFQAVLAVNGVNITLQFFLRYNEIAEYWTMKITDPKTSTVLLDSVPLLTGDYPAANLLHQYGYLKIGTAYLVNVGNVSDNPSDKDLGVNFILAWGDNE
jgi:hypothetical protein